MNGLLIRSVKACHPNPLSRYSIPRKILTGKISKPAYFHFSINPTIKVRISNSPSHDPDPNSNSEYNSEASKLSPPFQYDSHWHKHTCNKEYEGKR